MRSTSGRKRLTKEHNIHAASMSHFCLLSGSNVHDHSGHDDRKAEGGKAGSQIHFMGSERCDTLSIPAPSVARYNLSPLPCAPISLCTTNCRITDCTESPRHSDHLTGSTGCSLVMYLVPSFFSLSFFAPVTRLSALLAASSCSFHKKGKSVCRMKGMFT